VGAEHTKGVYQSYPPPVTGGLQGIEHRITPRARVEISDAIEEAQGNEVFFLAKRDEDGLVEDVEVHCRGHKTAVPALLQLGRPGEVVIHNHPSGRLTPSDADLRLAAHYGQEGVGFYIVDNTAEAVYVVVEPPKNEAKSVGDDAVGLVFTAEGALPAMLDGFEPRPGQIELAQQVARTQNGDRVLVAEAGTGTGKSLAYLLPSAMRALSNGDRVAIATRTIHLQQQLMNKDVPVVRQLFPEIRAALLQGRGNYLCKRKLQGRLAEVSAKSDPDERRFLEQLQEWSDATPDGSLHDLPFVPPRDRWEGVQSNTEHTLRVRCPHYESCFYYSSRRSAAQAQLLLVNHHLLLADLHLKREGVPGGLLPRYRHVVVDEAHHLEDTATDFAGAEVTSSGILRVLGRMRPVRGRSKGVVGRLRNVLREAAPSPEKDELFAAVDSMSADTELARQVVRVRCDEVVEVLLSAEGGRRNVQLRLHDDLVTKRPDLHAALAEPLEQLGRELASVARSIEYTRGRFSDMDEPFRRKNVQTNMDLGSAQRRLVGYAATLRDLLTPDPDACRWIEIRTSRDGLTSPRFNRKPIDVAAVVKETLVEGTASLVLTSATLAVDDQFTHFHDRTGLLAAAGADRTDGLLIPSPFDYGTQVLLGLPSDLPEPGRPGYEEAIADTVSALIEATRGRTFVLFTSYAALRRAADAVSSRLGPDFRILRQGELPRDALLQTFRTTPKAALFGTDSFWEGVDVRGEALSCVILPRLPFRVPSEPIQKARAERIEANGGDAFRDLSVPQAVLKFKQGFGRLVRHRDDRGAVIVLDARILRRGYGKTFVNSLPKDLRPLRAPFTRVLAAVQDLLGS
jgi:ATP-dependent DNA helicase DinG